MIPTDLLKLIQKYNEDGIFVRIDKYVYWFNGKNLKYWTVFANPIITYKKALYTRRYGDLLIYKKNKFQIVERPTEIWHPLYLFMEYTEHLKCVQNKTIYYLPAMLFRDTNTNHICIQSSKTGCYSQIFYYKHFLYLFHTTTFVEKYNLITSEWTKLASRPPLLEHYWKLYLFNNTFYAFVSTKQITYLPLLDQWEVKNLLFSPNDSSCIASID